MPRSTLGIRGRPAPHQPNTVSKTSVNLIAPAPVAVQRTGMILSRVAAAAAARVSRVSTEPRTHGPKAKFQAGQGIVVEGYIREI